MSEEEKSSKGIIKVLHAASLRPLCSPHFLRQPAQIAGKLETSSAFIMECFSRVPYQSLSTSSPGLFATCLANEQRCALWGRSPVLTSSVSMLKMGTFSPKWHLLQTKKKGKVSEGWTRWSLEVPSKPDDCVIPWQSTVHWVFLTWEMIPTSRKLANSVYRLERLAGFQRKTEENAQERKNIHYCLPMKTKNTLSLCPTNCSRPVFKNKS